MKITVNDSNFKDEVLSSELPVLVDFWAEWCGPCRMVEPIINEIANEYDGKVKVCALNVDDSKTTAVEYNIMSIPTLAVFKNGEVAEKSVGALPKEAIVNMLNKYL